MQPLDQAIAELDREIDELKSRLERLNRLRQQFVHDRPLGEEIVRFAHRLTNPNGMPQTPMSSSNGPLLVKKNSKNSTLDRVVAHFQSVGNEWQSAREIAEKTELPVGSVNGLFFNSKHKDMFESRKESEKRKFYRLRVGNE